MPRVGSRGKKINTETMFTFQGHMEIDELDIFWREMRLLLCIDRGVIEQDILEFFFDMRDAIQNLLSDANIGFIFAHRTRLQEILNREIGVRRILQDELDRTRRPELMV